MTLKMEESDIVESICNLLAAGKVQEARTALSNDYRFSPIRPEGRRYSRQESLRVFQRDGYLDRYSGRRLIFPGTLRLLSFLLPEHFPYHPNWKMSDTHLAYWQLSPTIDHLVPVARGGRDDESNWITTSQLRNSAKSNWLLEELGWTLFPPGDLKKWDGLCGWFISRISAEPALLNHTAIMNWHKTLTRFPEI